ncbi:MAG TPA: amino acid permease [Luteitalea sp.]|nr:amino acid permease [Luteitalea sp.]
MTAPASSESPVALVRGLGLLAAFSLVVGNVIGTGVFLKARVMTCNVDTPGMVIAVWVIAGVMSLLGALTYAELATVLPEAGGEYVFIRKAYGRLLGFLYGWTRFFVATAGSLAALATGFAIFATALLGLRDWHATIFLPFGQSIDDVQALAIIAIWTVTLINCADVSTGGRVASVLTVTKIALVSAVGLGAFLLADGSWANYGLSGAGGTCEAVDAAARGGMAGIGAAMMAALWGYNGWNEVTYVAGEVKDPSRALPLAIIGGILTVATLYVTVNAGYFYVLTPQQVASVPASGAVATVAATEFLGPAATRLMSGLLSVSVLTALQIVALVGARIPYAMAQDGVFFRSLATLSPRTRVPVRALLAQAVWASVLVVSGSFDTLTDYVIFAVLIFMGLATASVFVFRRTMPDVPRPYKTWGYPVVPVLFLITAGWLIVNTLQTSPTQALSGLGLVALGVPFYLYWTRSRA